MPNLKTPFIPVAPAYDTELNAVLMAINGSNRISFQFEMLDTANNSLGLLDNVVPGGQINYNYEADIKRSLSFTIVDQSYNRFNPYYNRIKVYMIVEDPETNKSWKFPQGVYLNTTGTEKLDNDFSSEISIEAYDLGLILRDNRTVTRYIIPSGSLVVPAVRTILNAHKIEHNITESAEITPNQRSWDIGTPYLQIVKELLGGIGYEDMYFDDNGVCTSKPFVDFAKRPPTQFYSGGEYSMIATATSQIDTYNVPNRVVLTVSQPDQTVLTSVLSNTNPKSPTSTVVQNRIITESFTDVQATSQYSLNLLARKKLAEVSQPTDTVTFSTLISPLHGYGSAVSFDYGSKTDTYFEVGYTLPLTAGELMNVTIRRSVDVSEEVA